MWRKIFTFVGLMACSIAALGNSVSGPATDSDGTYTISYSASSCGGWQYQLKENGIAMMLGQCYSNVSGSYNRTNMPTGTYVYELDLCLDDPWIGYMCQSHFGPIPTHTVTVSQPIPGFPGAISLPQTDGDGAYAISWGVAPGSVGTYNLQQQLNGGAWSTIQNSAAASRSISGNGNGTYSYRVQACNAAGCSGWTATATIYVAIAPGVPSSISVSPTTSIDGSFTVSWGASSGSITYYQLYRQQNSGSWVLVTNLYGSPWTYSQTGLGNGEYSYQVRACNNVGGYINCSGYRTSATYTVLITPGVPGSISGPGSDSDGSFSLSWSAASGSVSSYQLERQLGTGSWSTIQNTSSTSRSESALADGSYSYRARACNSASCSGWTATKAVLVQHPPSTPGAISGSSLSHGGSNQDNDGAFTISWGASSGAISSYELQEQTNGGNFSTIQNISATSRSISGKDNGTYGYRVRGCNSSGCSGWTATKTIEVINTPGIPGTISGPSSDADGVFFLSWSAASGTVNDYRLERQTNGGSWSQIQSSTATSRNESVGYGTYGYRVRACNVLSCSGYSGTKTVTVVAAPGVPGGFTLPTFSNSGSFSVSWNTASGTVSSYELQRKSSLGTWQTLQNTSGLSRGESGLSNESYTYRVRACNSAFCSGWTTEKSILVVKNSDAFPSSSVLPSLLGDVNVGATEIGVSVGADGSAEASLQMSVPEGVNGMHPNIVLTYNSNGGNTSIGLGWDISGISSIDRCPSNKDFGGSIDPVDFDSNDKYCLDGSPLVAVVGNYGAEGTEYRTRAESFVKVISHGSVGNCVRNGVNVDGPVWFEVKTPAGQTLQYGNTEDSRLQAPGCTDVVSWAVNRNEDTFGNAVNYIYSDIGGEQLIDQVLYNNNLSKIKFTYQNRLDQSTTYSVGSAFLSTKILNNVEVFESNVSLRKYNLTYENDAITQESRLKTVQECAQTECLPATIVNWTSDQNPIGGFASSDWTVTNQWGPDKNIFTGDFNGDGFEDIASVAADGLQVYMHLSIGNGFQRQTWPVTNEWGGKTTVHGGAGGGYTSFERYTHTGDFNGDGLTDIASQDGDKVYLKLSTGYGFDSVTWNVGSQWGQNHYTWTADFNGDGLTDFASADYGNIHMKLSTGAGFTSATWVTAYNFNGPENVYIEDFNGDGLTDIGVRNGVDVYMKLSTGGSFNEQTWYAGSNWGGADWTFTGDFNGDGYTDLASRNGVSMFMKLSNGHGFVNQTWPVDGSNWGSAGYTRVGDFNGDGISDFGSANSGTMHTYISRLNGFVRRSWSVANTWGSANTAFYSDFDGDSITDVVAVDGSYLRRKMSTTKPTVINKVTNGFGHETKINYKFLTDTSVYTKGFMHTGYPNIPFVYAGYVVSKLEYGNGVGGYLSSSYKYDDLRLHVERYGLLGFANITMTDDQSGISTRTQYSQDYVGRKQGVPQFIEVKASNGTVLQSTTTNYQFPITTWGAGDSYRYQIRPLSSITTSRDLNGAFLHWESANYNNYDAYGNATQIVTELYNESDQLLRTVTVDNVLSHDTSKWFLGRVTQSIVTTQETGKPTRKRWQSWQYDNNTNRLLSERVHHPDTGVILLESRYGEDQYGNPAVDGFGNNLATTLKGVNFASRTSHVQFDPTGRRIVSSTNPIGHSGSTEYYPANSFTNGAYPNKPKIVTNANGVKAKFTYDVFGRVVTSSAAWNTVSQVDSQTAYRFCDSSCPGNAVYYIVSQSEGGGEGRTYVDQVGRTLREGGQTKRVIGNPSEFVHVDYQYDSRGRNTGISEPYFEGATPSHWTSIAYDDLNRPTASTMPDMRVDSVDYNGLTVTSHIDLFNKNQEKTVISNAFGQVIKATDENGEDLDYEYDSHGNLLKVIDPENNETIMNYDAVDRKISMIDPDKGSWSYTYNSLGQLITQTNGRNERTCYAYDLLGRTVKQIDYYQGGISSIIGQNSQSTTQCSGDTSNPETATWIYDSANGAGKGKLHTVQGSNGFQQVMTYNSLGLPYEVTETLNGNSYTTTAIYDQLNRPLLTIYPGADERFVTKTIYNDLSMPVEIRNGTNNVPYYQLKELNARGQVVEEEYGNGVTNAYGYYNDTGLPSFIGAFRSGSGVYDLQSQTFDFDLIGNLTHREDIVNNYEETFTYDSLNRLTTAQADMGNGDVRTTTVTYDRLGNIRSKTGVGNYSYDNECTNAYGPHAVCQIGGTKNTSYAYDANGNMTSGDGRSLTYTIFDKPNHIQKGSNITDITYGPDRSRYFRKDTNGSAITEYTYAGAYEKVTFKNGATVTKVEERHHVAGLAIVTYINRGLPNASDTTRFLHKDHLGSINLITDEVGEAFERFSYDPWGKKRAPTLAQLQAILAKPWSAMTTNEKGNLTINSALLTSTVTNRGFTGHEQMDGIGLIHMNGRVYDPEIGRMLQADPFVPDFTDLQSFNRYSYVNNNPLSYTDPSGYFFKKIRDRHKRHYNKLKGHLKRKYARNKTWSRNFLNQVGEVLGDTITSYAINIVAGFASIYCGPCGIAIAGALHYDYARSQGVSSKQARKIAVIAAVVYAVGTKAYKIGNVHVVFSYSPGVIGTIGGGSSEDEGNVRSPCFNGTVKCFGGADYDSGGSGGQNYFDRVVISGRGVATGLFGAFLLFIAATPDQALFYDFGAGLYDDPADAELFQMAHNFGYALGFWSALASPKASSSPRKFSNKYPQDGVDVPLSVDLGTLRTGKLNYVVLEDGTLLFGRIRKGPGGGHIDLANGQPVIAAGEVTLINGKVHSINNASGHYLPRGGSAKSEAIKAFEKNGFSASGKYQEVF